MNADQIIKFLQLQPHPEGGWYKQTWKSNDLCSGRAVGTSIYFLLKENEISHWHKIDSVEIWHFYDGSPLILKTAINENSNVKTQILGPNLAKLQSPQITVEKNLWQSAETTGDYTLVGCTVSPGFEFSNFTLADKKFNPSI